MKKIFTLIAVATMALGTKVYPVYEFSVAAGANTINFADGAINIYSLVFVAGEGGGGEKWWWFFHYW